MEVNSKIFVGRDKPLVYGLKESMKHAKAVDISVSFIIESGVRLLQKDLKLLAEKNVPVRVLVDEYMNITQPQALYLLKEILGDGIDLRFYHDENQHFHPKAYFFHYESGSEVFIGSSNISYSALTTGIEWNYKINSRDDLCEYEDFFNEFEMLFRHCSLPIDDDILRRYAKNWRAPKWRPKEPDEKGKESGEEPKIIELVQPRGAQIEALYELRKTRQEGMNKALVVAATGVGKTYLAAFDCKDFQRILFVAHREEILKQACHSFQRVYPDKSLGFFCKDNKDFDKDVLFASVQTLGKEKYLQPGHFSAEYFDYIVIDEFHHAVAETYQRILNYFHPQFLLGLTATPDRLDNRDIYRLCDYNLVYEADLFTAINRDWLVPFRYYGVFDATDYNGISYRNGKYDEQELEKVLMLHQRSELIVSHYRKYGSKAALGFCVTQNHALHMAAYFNEAGISAMAVVSGSGGTPRQDALAALRQGAVRVLFAVDMFNEGVDIPSLDMLLFLRPTESPTVFLQQLGRGLRKYSKKQYVNVLDFIGNYRKAFLVPSLLCGMQYKVSTVAENCNFFEHLNEAAPQDCWIDFDFHIVNIMEQQLKQQMSVRQLVADEYWRVKEYIGARPNRVEFFNYIDRGIYKMIRSKASRNPFRNYLKFLNELGELTVEEKKFLFSFAGEFLNMVETTSMSKTYKLPVFLAFIEGERIHMTINEKRICASFRQFYSNPSNGIDMRRDKTTSGYLSWPDSEFIKLAVKNPIYFLLKSASEFFNQDDGLLCLNKELKTFSENKSFINQLKDCIELRRIQFYVQRLEILEQV